MWKIEWKIISEMKRKNKIKKTKQQSNNKQKKKKFLKWINDEKVSILCLSFFLVVWFITFQQSG